MEDVLNILEIIKSSCIEISNVIKNSNSIELSKYSEKYNLSGDNAKKLDLISNSILKTKLEKSNLIRKIGSEEEENLCETEFKNAPYMVCFDPLDGSSNIAVNITTGTIFCVYQFKNNKIKDGNNIVMAGYCLYGGSTQLVVAIEKVKMYQLIDNKFNLINDSLIIPNKGKYYSINESNKNIWLDERNKNSCDKFIKLNYSARWVGSLVADGHRTLIKGGFFSYPGNKKNPNGKIRLLYEAYPFAYIFLKAGGESLNEVENKILLDIPFPDYCHQKTPIILSSTFEMNIFKN